MTTYRTGNHWGVTIVREGEATHDWRPFNVGETVCAEAECRLSKAEHAQLVAVVVNGDQALAERICALLNADERCWHGEHCPGSGPECERDAPLKDGHRDCAAAWHANHGCATEPFDSCTCPTPYRSSVAADPECSVHHGRRARGPKPPPLGLGCICDGSGRTCPRHGAVI